MPKYKPKLRFDVATFSETDARYFPTSTYLPHSGGAPVVPNEVPRVREPMPGRRPELAAERNIRSTERLSVVVAD